MTFTLIFFFFNFIFARKIISKRLKATRSGSRSTYAFLSTIPKFSLYTSKPLHISKIFPIENDNFQVIYKWNLFSSQKKRQCDKDWSILHCATLTYQIKHVTQKCPIQNVFHSNLTLFV